MKSPKTPDDFDALEAEIRARAALVRAGGRNADALDHAAHCVTVARTVASLGIDPFALAAAAAPDRAARAERDRWVLVEAAGTDAEHVIGRFPSFRLAAQAQRDWGEGADIMVQLPSGHLSTEF